MGKSVFFTFIFIFILILSGCRNPVKKTPTIISHDPIASFQTGDFKISGAGTTAANGVYAFAGELNSSAYFTQIGGDYKIFVNAYTGTSPYPAGNYWAIDTDVSTTDFFSLDFVAYDVGAAEYWLPEDISWNTVSGINPAGTISGIPFTVGNDNGDAAGEQVDINYIYSDPDGDPEAGTEIKWFRVDAVTSLVTDVSSLEVASGSLSYTIQNEDLNKFLKVLVVPVDSEGDRGAEIVSKAYRRLKSGS